MRFVTFLVLCIFATSVKGWSYVLIEDGPLVEKSEFAIVGVIERELQHFEFSKKSVEKLNMITRQYMVSIERVMKGNEIEAGDVITVVTHGGFDPKSNTTLVIPGVPEFMEGERVILLLVKHKEHFFVNEFSMGAFYEMRLKSSPKIALRGLERIEEEEEKKPIDSAIKVRDFLKFADFIERFSQKREVSEYMIQVSLSEVTKAREFQNYAKRFTAFTTPNNNPIRNFNFDNGPVNWRRHNAGQPGVAGGGQTEFDNSLANWNGNVNTAINYVDIGTTATVGSGLTGTDGVNTIIYEDPNGEIPGSFSCSTGGTLAIGGFFYSSNTRTFRSITFNPIIEVDIVVQNGISCWIQSYAPSIGSKNLENVYAHELGHTLGLRHSCGDDGIIPCTNSVYDDALMRAAAHSDGRGGVLRADDNLGIEYLYAICYPCPITTGGVQITSAPLTTVFSISTGAITTDAISTAPLTSSPLTTAPLYGIGENSQSSDVITAGGLKFKWYYAAAAAGGLLLIIAAIITFFALRGKGKKSHDHHKRMEMTNMTASPAFSIGTVVFAPWNANGQLYRGQIMDFKNGQYLIAFHDFKGPAEWKPASAIRAI